MELLILAGLVYLLSNSSDFNGDNMKLSIANKNTYKDLVKIANDKGFFVTSTTGGVHNSGSKHAKGLAIDVRTHDKEPTQINEFISYARSFGVRVLDERTRPKGQVVWSGAHLHLELV